MTDLETDAGHHNIEISLVNSIDSAESTVDDMQPGPSVPNQRASVIVVQPNSSEIRTDSSESNTLNILNENSEIQINSASRDGGVTSPVFHRRRRRGINTYFLNIK